MTIVPEGTVGTPPYTTQGCSSVGAYTAGLLFSNFFLPLSLQPHELSHAPAAIAVHGGRIHFFCSPPNHMQKLMFGSGFAESWFGSFTRPFSVRYHIKKLASS